MTKMFILNRNHVLAVGGHMIRFEKGVETYVPPEVERAAIGIGAEVVGGSVVMGEDDDDAKLPAALTDDEKYEQYKEAFSLLSESHDREDFDGTGKPTVDAVRKLVDFKFVKKELHTAWQRFNEEKAAALL